MPLWIVHARRECAVARDRKRARVNARATGAPRLGGEAERDRVERGRAVVRVGDGRVVLRQEGRRRAGSRPGLVAGPAGHERGDAGLIRGSGKARFIAADEPPLSTALSYVRPYTWEGPGQHTETGGVVSGAAGGAAVSPAENDQRRGDAGVGLTVLRPDRRVEGKSIRSVVRNCGRIRLGDLRARRSWGMRTGMTPGSGSSRTRGRLAAHFVREDVRVRGGCAAGGSNARRRTSSCALYGAASADTYEYVEM